MESNSPHDGSSAKIKRKNSILLTENGEDGRVAEPLAGHVLRRAGVVAHVGQPGLNDEQVSLG